MLYFDHQDPTAQEVQYVFHQTEANALMPVFNLGIALLILFVSVWIMYTFAKAFITYEKLVLNNHGACNNCCGSIP